MGQNQLSQSNPLFEDWQKHPNISNVFVNIRTHQQAQLLQITLKKPQEMFLKKRITDSHNFISKILYYHPCNSVESQSDRFFVYIQRLLPISYDMWIPVTSGLSILKGFRRLSSTYGPIRVTASMVKVNIGKQIKVWINQDPIKFQIMERAENEEQMLVDIVKIIMNFDPSTGSLLTNCYTLNDAISHILHNMTENKSIINLSNRTENKQQKYYRKGTTITKNNFRSTQQTEDDSLKPFDQSLKPSRGQEPTNNKFLHNVQSIKAPVFVNTDSDQLRKANTSKISKDNTNFSYSQQNMQKVSNSQFNSSQPAKMSSIEGSRPFKPIKHRVQVTESAYHTFNNDKPKRGISKFKSLLEKPNQQTYYPGRQSNLSKNQIEKIEGMQGSQFAIQSNNGSIHTHQKSEQMNTSRELQFTSKYPSQIFSTANRTKTQQFYSPYNDHFGYSPRLKTNWIGVKNQNIEQPTSYSIMNIPKRTPEQFQYINVNNPKDPKENQNIDNNDDKRQMKLKQAQMIKEEMGFLGIANESTKPLLNEKSARDLLIKQKVQQKNKKHEELKFAITKLLND